MGWYRAKTMGVGPDGGRIRAGECFAFDGPRASWMEPIAPPAEQSGDEPADEEAPSAPPALPPPALAPRPAKPKAAKPNTDQSDTEA